MQFSYQDNDDNEIVRSTNDDATVSRLQVFPGPCPYQDELTMSHTHTRTDLPLPKDTLLMTL